MSSELKAMPLAVGRIFNDQPPTRSLPWNNWLMVISSAGIFVGSTEASGSGEFSSARTCGSGAGNRTYCRLITIGAAFASGMLALPLAC
ncbi:hypothetical protein D3C85_1006150 [compost metagenome]